MDTEDATNTAAILARIQAQAATETLRISVHNYPEHRRGACCLLSGRTAGARPLHLVCT